jgi:broad specificity phosphatase PhoE
VPPAPQIPTPAGAASVLVIRHAQSTWNADARWQGQADPPLSGDGDRQVEAAADRLADLIGSGPRVDLMITSDLKRARSTAERLAAGMGVAPPHLLLADLREYDVGAWSGLTRAEIELRWPEQLARFDRGDLDRPPGGESRAAFDVRVRRAAADVAGLIEGHRSRLGLVVTHGGVIRSLARTGGLPEVHIGHLGGYWAVPGPGGLELADPVRLLSSPQWGGAAADPDGEQDRL